MGQAIGQILPLAVAAGLSPFPIIGIVLMLTSDHARANGLAFLVGWVAGLAIVGAAVLLISSDANASTAAGPATWVNIIKIAAGAALLGLAVKKWKARPQAGEQPKLPGWMSAVSSFTAPRAAGLGFALSAINPKCLLLTLAAGVTIAQTGIETFEQAGTLAFYVAIATVGVAVPLGTHLTMGQRAAAPLARLRTWMEDNNNTIMAVICLVIAAKLIGDGISGLSS